MHAELDTAVIQMAITILTTMYQVKYEIKQHSNYRWHDLKLGISQITHSHVDILVCASEMHVWPD